MHRDAQQPQQHGRGWRARQGQPQHAQSARQRRALGVIGQGRQPEHEQSGAAQLQQRRRCLVSRFGQPQTGQQPQQTAIGNGACIVGRARFATKSEADRLRRPRTRQIVDAEPAPQQGQQQNAHEYQAHRQRCCHPTGRQANGPSPQPIRQQRLKMGWFAQNARPHPRRSSLRQLQHVAEADEIIAFPGFAPYKTLQSINQTQQQQAPARQAAHALLGNDGR